MWHERVLPALISTPELLLYYCLYEPFHLLNTSTFTVYLQSTRLNIDTLKLEAVLFVANFSSLLSYYIPRKKLKNLSDVYIYQ